MVNPLITVLLPTYNRPNLARKCIESLLGQTFKDKKLIVLDQSDNNDTKIICNELGVDCLRLDFKNKSKSINFGIKGSLSDYVAIIDDDCIATPEWLESLINNLIKNKSDIVTGRVAAGEIESNSVKSRLDDSISKYKVFSKGFTTPIFILSGCNFAFNKKVIDRIGSFDENFGPGSKFLSSDDNEWGYRALINNYKIVYEPSALVIHRSWRSKYEDLMQMKSYGYSAGAFFSKMSEVSLIDFIFHSFNLIKWLFVEYIKNIASKNDRQQYVIYLGSFFDGFFDYRNFKK